MLKRARANVEDMLPRTPNLRMELRDVYAGFEERGLDRIVLDLPEPWQVVPHALEALVPGGIFLSFLPTVLQFHELTHALRGTRQFDLVETFEVLVRPWTVGGRSVRPAQRMVSHTGFITTARKCAPVPQEAREETDEDPQDA